MLAAAYSDVSPPGASRLLARAGDPLPSPPLGGGAFSAHPARVHARRCLDSLRALVNGLTPSDLLPDAALAGYGAGGSAEGWGWGVANGAPAHLGSGAAASGAESASAGSPDAELMEEGWPEPVRGVPGGERAGGSLSGAGGGGSMTRQLFPPPTFLVVPAQWRARDGESWVTRAVPTRVLAAAAESGRAAAGIGASPAQALGATLPPRFAVRRSPLLYAALAPPPPPLPAVPASASVPGGWPPLPLVRLVVYGGLLGGDGGGGLDGLSGGALPPPEYAVAVDAPAALEAVLALVARAPPLGTLTRADLMVALPSATLVSGGLSCIAEALLVHVLRVLCFAGYLQQLDDDGCPGADERGSVAEAR